MRRRWAVFIAVVSLFAARAAHAHEPDGRLALRYEWDSAATADGSRPLRISITAIVALRDVRVSAKVPDRTSVAIRAFRIAGRASSNAPDTRWPDAGLALGELAPGQTVLFDLDVAEPAQGGGILEIGLDGADGERAIHEGIGIAVGLPGTAPTLRNGALEFPAEPGDRAP